MGADFLLTCCRLPKKESWKGDQREKDLLLAPEDVAAIKDQFCNRVTAIPTESLRVWYERIDPWEDISDDEDTLRTKALNELWLMFTDIMNFIDCRTCTTMRFDGVDYLFTGGLSHGDSPTDEYDTISGFRWFDEELLKEPFVV